MVNYEAQINQAPIPYYTIPVKSSKDNILGMSIAGGIVGMNAYFLPIKKDAFVQRAFNVTKQEAFNHINTLEKIAREVEQNQISPKSKMILQDFGLSEDIVEIGRKCSDLAEEVTDPDKVKALKADFDNNFDNYKKKPSLMDNNCAEAFRLIKRNKFRWGVGIGAGIGLALGLMTSRD